MDPSKIVPPHQVDSTSTRLLARVARQDPQAWELFVRIYGPVVRYWIRRAGLKDADVADVFQDVFLAVLRGLARYQRESGTAKFRAWLKAVAVSKVQDHFRRRNNRPEALGGPETQQQLAELVAPNTLLADNEDDDPALDHSEAAFVAQGILRLIRPEFREQTWQAFQLTALEGLTSSEAAQRLGMSALAVRKAKSRIMQRLKEALAESAGPPLERGPNS